MRICIIGKFPPIQGGVSMRTYWTAHGLAARGHEVHVVTNAKEVRPPFRMYMRAGDWGRCEAVYDRGSVTVHWTDPVDDSQFYIPMASPYVSKLASVAARVNSDFPYDIIFSHYLEPYGVAAHLAAKMTGVPHVVRMAGSDAGRLWHHPQFEALYDHILTSAEIVIAAGMVFERAIQRGVAADRIAYGGEFVLQDDLFTPDGPTLDLSALRNEVEGDPHFRRHQWGDLEPQRPHFGVYGKLGESKGSYALLAAMHRLKHEGLEVGLVALAHGEPSIERRFRARARKLGLVDHIHQIPFLPHWRVPEFVRGCIGVCCLEQDFPIAFHTPIIPREVLLCGACLVSSIELIRKFPTCGRMVDGYNCVAIDDVNDVGALAERLASIVQDPKPVASVGARGRAFAQDLQKGVPFTTTLEDLFQTAIARQRVPLTMRRSVDETANQPGEGRFPYTQIAETALDKVRGSRKAVQPGRLIDLARARQSLAAVEKAVVNGHADLHFLLPAIRVEIAVAVAESEADGAAPAKGVDPCFRMRIGRWAMGEDDLARLVPVRDPCLRVLEFDCDVSQFGMQTATTYSSAPSVSRSYIVVFGRSDHGRRDPLLVDILTAKILDLSDGSRTASEVARHLTPEGDASQIESRLKWIENLFVWGLVALQDDRIGPIDGQTNGSIRKIFVN